MAETFIREVLDLEPLATELVIPKQGPARPGTSAGRGSREERGGGRGGSGGGRRGRAVAAGEEAAGAAGVQVEAVRARWRGWGDLESAAATSTSVPVRPCEFLT